MSNGYKELIKGNPGETEIRSFLVNGDQVSVTLFTPYMLTQTLWQAEKSFMLHQMRQTALPLFLMKM